jgi:hypothetical protein
VKPRQILVAGGAVTFLGLLACGTVGGTLASWVLLIGWISFIFGLHRFGRAKEG